jgi:aldehyde:ferredoxin oxidoreductase
LHVWSLGDERERRPRRGRDQGHGTQLDPTFMEPLGRETLRMEWEFNRQAGFTGQDDELPEFFHTDPMPSTGNKARHRSVDVIRHLQELLANG